MRKIFLFFGLVIFIILQGSNSSTADLIRGARPIALSGAYNTVEGDANALFNNIAGIGRIQRHMLELSYMPVMGVEDLYYFRMGYVLPAFDFKPGIAYNSVFLSDFYSENEFILGASYELKKYLVAGLRTKYVFLSVNKEKDEQGFNSRDSYFTFDLGFLINIVDYLDCGITGNNLTDPQVSFSKNPSNLRSYRTLVTGVKVNFTDYFFVTVDEEFRRGEDMIVRAGSELWFYNTVAIRAGLSENEMFSLGAGLKTYYFVLDFGLQAHAELGNQYQVDLTICY